VAFPAKFFPFSVVSVVSVISCSKSLVADLPGSGALENPWSIPFLGGHEASEVKSHFGFTVKTALELVADPTEFDTTTEYVPPWLGWTLVRLRNVLVAPGRFVPLKRQ
jgi:hypothetical protein